MNTYAGSMTGKQLWRMDPSMRPVSVLGIVAGTAGGDDLVVALAGGARTSVLGRALEDRATIAGGLHALKAVGRYQGSTSFPVRLFQGKNEDLKLIHAANGKDLKSAARKIRDEVASAGVERTAFAARGLLILQSLSGFQKIRGIAGGVSAAVGGPIGAAIAAAMGAHGAITAAVAQGLLKRFEQDMGVGTAPKGPALTSGPAQPASLQPQTVTESASAVFPWAPVLVGIGVIVGGIAIYRRLQ